MAERLNTTGYDGVSIALLIVVFGVLTGLMLGAAAIRNRNALFLVAVQCVLLTGAVLIGG
jgi:predicted transporter